MDAKPVFDGFLEAFRFGELLRLDLFTVRNHIFLWELCKIGLLNAKKKKKLSIRISFSMLPSSGFHFALQNEVRAAQCQINILLPNIRLILTHYEKFNDGLSSNRQTGNFA